MAVAVENGGTLEIPLKDSQDEVSLSFHCLPDFKSQSL